MSNHRGSRPNIWKYDTLSDRPSRRKAALGSPNINATIFYHIYAPCPRAKLDGKQLDLIGGALDMLPKTILGCTELPF
jgi:hypothetical protein